MATFTEGKKRLNGSFGYLQIDGEDWGEVCGIEIRVTATYTDVQRGMDKDAKLVGRSGMGKISTIKAYSRGKSMFESLKNGVEPSVRLIAWIADPDAEGAQEERVVIENVKFEELDILSLRYGKLVEAEYPFRFAPSDLIYQDSITAK